MAIVKAVEKGENAIGYGGLAYGKNVIHCSINQVQPSEQNVKANRYPLSRYLYFYAIDTPRCPVKAFIDWVLKDEQKIVHEVGCVPLWEE
jgi:phosphate transport system substrate-binding protein